VGNGKIIYTPLSTCALVLDGTHYLSLADAAFNAGSNSFGVDILGKVDPAVADSECWLAAKGALSLASAAGWHFYYKPASRRLGVRLNDGGLTPVVVETADNALPALGTHFWGRLEIDRTAKLARLYVDGLLGQSGDISGLSGSLTSTEPLKIGGYDASTNRHKGHLDLLRFDLGRVLPAAWHELEWYRLKYGGPRELADFLAVWTFYGEVLTDLSSDAFTLTWQGGGSPAYAAGWPGSAGSITYQFADNFEFGHELGYLDLDDNQRLAEGSAFNYPHPNQKRTFLLPFKAIGPEQQAALAAAWLGKQNVGLYLDADKPLTATVWLQKYPLQRSVFTNRVDAELDAEEV
jgi:hypothetical protein